MGALTRINRAAAARGADKWRPAAGAGRFDSLPRSAPPAGCGARRGAAPALRGSARALPECRCPASGAGRAPGARR